MLLRHQSIELYAPADEVEVKTLTDRLQAQLPDELSALWRISNGLGLPSIGAELMGVSAISNLLEHWDPNLQMGLLPILDLNSSNYVAICFRNPLTPRVAWTPHDSEARLLYKDLTRLIEVLLEFLDQNAVLMEDEDFDEYNEDLVLADLFFSETHGDYSSEAVRTAEEKDIGQKLLQQTSKEDQNWNREFAIQLLGT
jgi:hypothetical protein